MLKLTCLFVNIANKYLSILNILCDFFQGVRFYTRVRFCTIFGTLLKIWKK